MITPNPIAKKLGLSAHPEGGWYRRTYTSNTVDDSGRPLLTSILYLLNQGEVSRWHAVDADEAWHFHEGGVLTLHVYDPARRELSTHSLGAASAGLEPACVVPAGSWQAATVEGDYALVGCTVAPGFQFSGFCLVAEVPDADEHFNGPMKALRHLL